MKTRLLACPGCARHVRVSEPACVFCGLALPASFADKPALPPPPRMNRAGIFAYAGVLAASAAALVTANCGETLESVSSEGGSPDGTSDGYSVEDSSSGDSSSGEDAVAVLYGLPADAHFFEDAEPSDAGDAASPPADAGKPPVDASEPDVKTADSAPADAPHVDVGIAPPYGIAPLYGRPP